MNVLSSKYHPKDSICGHDNQGDGTKYVKEYIQSYPEVDGFLPLVVDTDEKGVFVGFTNEATFAVSLNSDMGYLNNETLLNYQNFQTSGMVIKKSTYENSGGIKPSVKLTFDVP